MKKQNNIMKNCYLIFKIDYLDGRSIKKLYYTL